MPWDGKSFAENHNHKLHGAAATKAARIASAMVRSGADEGISIATANKFGNKMLRRDDGGATDVYQRNQKWIKPGASSFNTTLTAPQESAFRDWLKSSNAPFDPEASKSDYDMRGFYSALMGGDPVAKSSVNQNDNQIHYPDYWKTPYHQSFSNESQWATPDAPHWGDGDKLIDNTGNVVFDERAQQRSDGGIVKTPSTGKALADSAYKLAKRMAKEQEKEANAKADAHFDMGGMPQVPFFERSEARNISDMHPPGLVAGAGPGRTDTVPTRVPSGSYVLSADVISGLGSGNTGHGADVMNKILQSTAPYGAQEIPLPRSRMGIPHPPAPYHAPELSSHFANGGKTQEPVEVQIADGEYLIFPHHVRAIGGGNIEKGHAILDAFSMTVRDHTIKQLKKLPPPKQAHEK